MRKLFINALSLGLFFPSMFWLLFELRWIENVVGGRWFVLLVLASASVPAWWAGRGIARAAYPWPNRSLLASGNDADRRREASSAGMLTGAGILVLAVCIASWTNHELAGRAADVEVTVIGREHRESTPRSPEQWRLIIDVRGRREDVVVSRYEWARSAPAARVSMRMMDGALGFPVLCSGVLRGRCRVEAIVREGAVAITVDTGRAPTPAACVVAGLARRCAVTRTQ